MKRGFMKKNISILLFTLFLSLSVTPFMQLEAKASSKSESSESKTGQGAKGRIVGGRGPNRSCADGHFHE